MVPPFRGDAIKFIDDPWQIIVIEAAILIDGITGLITVITMALDVAVTGFAQDELLVNIHVTMSALFNVLLL